MSWSLLLGIILTALAILFFILVGIYGIRYGKAYENMTEVAGAG